MADPAGRADGQDVGAAPTEAAPSGQRGGTDLGEMRTEAAADPGGSGGVATGPARGARIGRFTVLGELGRGGMGVVVSAYDPELDRRVAVKLVSARAPGRSERGRARLLGEARAMAKLRHPNVVTVHDVGEHDGQVYVAMDEVAGGTLRDALRALEASGRRDWRAVLDRFVRAGRGLAAAHAAGMVHRDFKPENVFVDDGRVAVGDFGLAHAHDPGAAQSPRDDAIAGTPAYMAPEQHEGVADARSDQFAFCVALYEALYGELPFAGTTRLAYLEATAAGAVKRPEPAGDTPRWLFDLIARGLSPDPEARFPSMEALLEELAPDPDTIWARGRRARAAAYLAFAAVACAWAIALVAVDGRLSYPLHYATNLGLLGVMVLVRWFGPRTLRQTRLNRDVVALAIAAGVCAVALAAGGDLLDIPADTLGILHLVVFGSGAAAATALLDRRVGVAAAVYLFGFVACAAIPSLFVPIILLAHGIGLASLLVVLSVPSQKR